MLLNRGSAGPKYSPSTVIACIAEHAHLQIAREGGFPPRKTGEMQEQKMKMKMNIRKM